MLLYTQTPFSPLVCARNLFPPSTLCCASFTTIQSLRALFYAIKIMIVCALFFRYRICERFHLLPFNPCDGSFRCASCSNTMKSISAHFSHDRVCDRAPLSQSETRARYFFAIEQIRPCLQGDRVSLALGVSLILGIQIARVYKQMEQSRDSPAVKDNSS